MQSELNNAVEAGYAACAPRRAADGAEGRAIQRIAVRFREFRMIRQVEEIGREDKPSPLSDRNLEVLLQREIEIVKTRIPDIREETRSIAKSFSDVTTGVWRKSD